MEEKKEIKKFDLAEIKKKVISSIGFPNNKECLLTDLSENIIPKCRSTKDSDQTEAFKQFGEKGLLLIRIFENESHAGLMESFNEQYRMLSKEMAETMIKEFDCSNEAEKSLVGLIVSAYIRVLDNSRRLNNELECKNITQNRNTYIANLSKQVDRANRQFLSALMTLKQIKLPQVEMNIKANTAFISNNQQINVDNKTNEAK